MSDRNKILQAIEELKERLTNLGNRVKAKTADEYDKILQEYPDVWVTMIDIETMNDKLVNYKNKE